MVGRWDLFFFFSLPKKKKEKEEQKSRDFFISISTQERERVGHRERRSADFGSSRLRRLRRRGGGVGRAPRTTLG